MKRITDRVREILPEIRAHRRALHSNPELSFMEYQTSEYIQSVLKGLGITFRIIAGTGVVAMIGSGERCVALRADIDALPVQEETGLEFDSRNDGVMHACGHDMHTSMLLGAAKILKEREDSLGGCVKLIFQPGEEQLPGGASLMISQGVLSDPVPMAVFGQHVNPGETVGKISVASGPVMASTDELYFTIKGKGTHAAQPHLGVDPILAASHLVIQLQTYISRFRNPLTPAVLSIASIQGGNTTNIIPETVRMKGTLRSFDSAWRNETLSRLGTFSKDICRAFMADCDFRAVNGYPALFNDTDAVQTARQTAVDMFGPDSAVEFEPKMWAEDFAYYAEKIPSAFWFLGVRPEGDDQMPALHNPGFSPSEDALFFGTSMLIGTAVRSLELRS